MGYRHYVGYLPKDKYEEVIAEAKRLEGLIGTPKEDCPDDTYSKFDVTNYLIEQVQYCEEIGKLYYGNTQPIYDLLYKNKTEDYSNCDTEFFFINDNNFFINLSIACMDCWNTYTKKLIPVFNKIFNKEELNIADMAEIAELSEMFERDIKQIEFSKKHGLKPFDEYRFYHLAQTYYDKYEDFNYEDKLLCVYAY